MFAALIVDSSSSSSTQSSRLTGDAVVFRTSIHSHVVSVTGSNMISVIATWPCATDADDATAAIAAILRHSEAVRHPMIAVFREAFEIHRAEWPRTENRRHYASGCPRFPERETKQVGQRVYAAELLC